MEKEELGGGKEQESQHFGITCQIKLVKEVSGTKKVIYFSSLEHKY